MSRRWHEDPDPSEASWVERALAEAPDEPAPGDGLARVMAEIERTPQVPAPGPGWTPAVAASLLGVAVGAGLIAWGGAWLMDAPQLLGYSVPSLGPVARLGLAALAFFGTGSFATLALAPVLLLESGPRRPLSAGR